MFATGWWKPGLFVFKSEVLFVTKYVYWIKEFPETNGEPTVFFHGNFPCIGGYWGQDTCRKKKEEDLLICAILGAN